MYFIVKCIISGILVGVVSEMAKRYPFLAAITASLPLTSILALIWLYRDTGDINKVAELSTGIAFIVLPSILFFVVLSLLLLKAEWNFYAALVTSCAAMTVSYFAYAWALKRVFGIKA